MDPYELAITDTLHDVIIARTDCIGYATMISACLNVDRYARHPVHLMLKEDPHENDNFPGGTDE